MRSVAGPAARTRATPSRSSPAPALAAVGPAPAAAGPRSADTAGPAPAAATPRADRGDRPVRAAAHDQHGPGRPPTDHQLHRPRLRDPARQRREALRPLQHPPFSGQATASSGPSPRERGTDPCPGSWRWTRESREPLRSSPSRNSCPSGTVAVKGCCRARPARPWARYGSSIALPLTVSRRRRRSRRPCRRRRRRPA